jgi:hypothetical protein
MICPIRKKKDRSAEEPNEFELNSIRNDPVKLATIRKEPPGTPGSTHLLVAASCVIWYTWSTAVID